MHHRWPAGATSGIVATILAAATGFASVAAATEAPIAAAVASLYVGHDAVVEGKVQAAERRDNSVRLRLGPNEQSLTVILVIGLLSKFPSQPESYYLGKNVRVAGSIESFRGTPEIIVRDPEHIQPVDRLTASAPQNAVDAREVSEQKQELQQLRSHVQELESRLKQVEQNPARP